MDSRSPTRPRVLLIGDDAADTALIEQMVAKEAGLAVDRASSDRLSEGIDALAGPGVDVVLLTFSLPDNHWLQTLRQTRDQASGLPIVVLTQRDDEEFAERALDLGAHDVLVTGRVSSRGLIRSLRHAVEHKGLAQALRESEERFRLLVEHAQDLIYRYRLAPTPGFDYVSPAALAITGYTPEEFYADPKLPFRLVHPADHGELVARQQSRPRQGPWVQTFRLRPKDGRVIWVEERIVPILGQAGIPVAFEGIIRDITERKRLEEERERLVVKLAAERRWLRTVIDHSPVGICLFEGASGEWVLSNRRAEELFGRPVTPKGGLFEYQKHVFRANGTTLEPDETSPFRALQGETVTAVERFIRRSDGQTVTVLASAGPIKDEQGNILGAVVVFEDISALKELERLREEWTSVIAHDLRQPLTVIEGYAGLLKYELGDNGSELTLWAESIQTSVSQLNRMIVDLLDASRIEAKRLETEREAVDLPTLVRSVVGRLEATIPNHPLRIVVDDEIPAVAADPGRLEQVLSNLFSNAAKYGYPNTEIEVTVQGSEGEVRVSVSNRGDGIPPEALPRLFQRFRRTRPARAKRIEGIGLGLYISKGIVEAHGGKIWAESTPGETTTFHFTLPVPPSS